MGMRALGDVSSFSYSHIKSLACFLLVSIAIVSLIIIPPSYVFAKGGTPDITAGLENYYFLSKGFNPGVGGVEISSIGILGDCDGVISDGSTVTKVEPKDCVFSVDAIKVTTDLLVNGEQPLFDILCIDDFDVKDEDWSTCTFVTQGDISMSIGMSIGGCPDFLVMAGSFLTLGPGLGLCIGLNMFSIDLPWVVGLPLKLSPAQYKEVGVGGNILQDSGIGGVKAKKFVVLTIAKNGIVGDIAFIGKKPHNMELFLGVTNHDKEQKCFSELDLNKAFDCTALPNVDGKRKEFADALKSGCLTCVLSGSDPNPLNMIAAEPEGLPDNVLDELDLGEILDENALETMSQFSINLADEASGIAIDAAVNSFEDLDLDGVLIEVEDEILAESAKLEDTLNRVLANTDLTDLTELIEKVPKLVKNIQDIIDDITSIVSSWDGIKAVFD